MAKDKRDKPPKGGWLAPPGNTEKLPPLASRVRKKGKTSWVSNKLSKKDKKKHDRFQKAMKKADKKGETYFQW